MSKEKQIEEMAKALTKYEKGLCERLPKDQCLLTSAVHAQVSCDYCKIAEFLYNAGYRKQSEGYWFFTEYEYFTCSKCGKSHFNFCDSSAEARRKLAEGEYYPYCPNCGAKIKGGVE